MENIGIIIPAAGQDQRMGKKINKQFLNLLGKPILYHTIKSFVDWGKAAEIVVVLNTEEFDHFNDKIKRFFSNMDTRIITADGGKSRKESVYNGIKSLKKDVEYVMIHDGARPLITVDLIESTYQAVKKFEAVSCGVKVKDTIKIVDESFSRKTLNRDSLRAIQTPQAFKTDLIISAHENFSKDAALDDASLVEELGKKVYIISGDYNNLKITSAEDLKPAEMILKERN